MQNIGFGCRIFILIILLVFLFGNTLLPVLGNDDKDGEYKKLTPKKYLIYGMKILLFIVIPFSDSKGLFLREIVYGKNRKQYIEIDKHLNIRLLILAESLFGMLIIVCTFYIEVNVYIKFFAGVITYIMFNWIGYILYWIKNRLYITINSKKGKLWSILIISPAVVIMSEIKIGNYKDIIPFLSYLYSFFVLIVLGVSFLFMWILMLQICTNKIDSLEAVNCKTVKNSIDEESSVCWTIVSLIIVNIVNYTTILFCANNRMSNILIKGDTYVTQWYDIIYYVVITYTSVGYGDIIPNGIFAKFITCAISISGYVTSVFIIGEIVFGLRRKHDSHNSIKGTSEGTVVVDKPTSKEEHLQIAEVE